MYRNLSAGDQIITHDIAASVSMTLIGVGPAETVVMPVAEAARIIRIGHSPVDASSNVARGTRIAQVSLKPRPETPCNGIELHGWNCAAIEDVGLLSLAVGLDLRPTRRAVGLDVNRVYATTCDTAIRVDLGQTSTQANNVIRGANITKGGIAIDLVNAGRGLPIMDCYAEAQDVCGVVVRAGRAKLIRGYYETQRQDLDGDGLPNELVPSVAVMPGATVELESVAKCSWLYIAPDGEVIIDEESARGLGYIVMHAADDRVPAMIAQYPVQPGAKARVLVIDGPWWPGAKVKPRRVLP